MVVLEEKAKSTAYTYKNMVVPEENNHGCGPRWHRSQHRWKVERRIRKIVVFGILAMFIAMVETRCSNVAGFFPGLPLQHRSSKEESKSTTQLRMATPRVGIIGLPNVGKSTLFNAVSRTADLARAANFPFCTIEPNKAPVPIPDPYLDELSKTFCSDDNIRGTLRPARIELIDVAGLVEGASRGEGLGNQFLAAIRECQVVVHVLRYFHDGDVIRDNSSGGIVDPIFDAAIVDHELLLADLAHVERRLDRIKEETMEKKALKKAHKALMESIPSRLAGLSEEEEFSIKSMGLLTLKPIVYAFNVDEMDFTIHRTRITETIREEIMPKIRQHNQVHDPTQPQNDFLLVSAKFEEDILSLGGPEEQGEYISELMDMADDSMVSGNGRPLADGTNTEKELVEQYQELLSYRVLPTRVCQLLSLSLCYTGPGVPPERSRTTKSYLFSFRDNNNPTTDPNEPETTPSSDSIPSSSNNSIGSMTIFELAGRIHGELQRGFIRAEVIKAGDLLRFRSFREAKEAGSVRTEGKDYIIEPDDTVLIKWRE